MIIKIACKEGERTNQLYAFTNNQPSHVITQQSSPLFFKSSITDILTNKSLSASFSLMSNTILFNPKMLIPKWLFGGESKSNIHVLHDENDTEVGSFYRSQKGFLRNKHVIECGIKLDCYSRSYGITRNIFIHKDAAQIAEIVIPLSVTNGFWCFIFLLDVYSNLNMLLLNIARCISSGSGTTSSSSSFDGHGVGRAGVSISTTYTKDGYSKLHDRNWIMNNFSFDEINAVNKEIAENRELAKNLIHNRRK